MKKLLLTFFIMTSTICAMELDALEKGTMRVHSKEEMYAQALADKTILPFDEALTLLTFCKENKSQEEYDSLLKTIAPRAQTKKTNKLLLEALIKAQNEHTQALMQQIELSKELAEKSSISTQKALKTAQWRLYVAGIATCLTTVSFALNILQMAKVISD